MDLKSSALRGLGEILGYLAVTPGMCANLTKNIHMVQNSVLRKLEQRVNPRTTAIVGLSSGC